MGHGVGRWIEFAVLHARACTHALHVARLNGLDIAHAVFVRQCARRDIGNDFHILMTMRAKPPPWSDKVFIDHPQVAKTHVQGVVIVSK